MAKILLASKDKKSLLQQKARLNWLRQGDVNSAFFHKAIARRRNLNGLVGLDIGGEWIECPQRVKNEVFRHFREHFQRRHNEEIRLPSDLLTDSLEMEDREKLCREISIDELKESVWDCASSKSPGPDGFNFNFFKGCWEIIAADLYKAVEDFWTNGRLVKGCNPSFIVLIPKCEGAKKLNQFRPISLIGSLYKVVAKILARRMKPVLGKIIGEAQSAFVKGRYILDGIATLNEIIEDANQKKAKRVLFKVDFAKAYDSIEWPYLLDMMDRMGFPARWRNWMFECMSSASASVLVNGSPSGDFWLHRGLRQGDPLSPFLFLIAAEGLNILINRAVQRGLLQPVVIGDERIKVSHLQYADDTLFAVDGTEDNVKAIKWILQIFECISGLAVNFDKCRIVGLNMTPAEVNEMADLVGCQSESLPIEYLGMKIGSGYGRVSNWEGVVDRVKKRLAGWESNKLSFGGKVTLIKSVLTAIPTYRLAFSPIPGGSAIALRKSQCRFLWGVGPGGSNKMAWVCWEDLCRSKKEGGLGFKDWKGFNLALLGKWIWRFVCEENSLWARIIKARHGTWETWGLETVVGRRWGRGKGWWGKIIAALEGSFGRWLCNNLRRSIGDGMMTNFWADRWCGDQSLRSRFPRLFHLCSNRNGKVGEMGRWVDGRWRWELSWRRALADRDRGRVAELETVLGEITLRHDATDCWCWGDKAGGTYTAKEAYRFISAQNDRREAVMGEPPTDMWNSVAPFKQQVVAWRVLKNRIPTRENLSKRMELSPEGKLCPCCAMAIESVAHILLSCVEVELLWRKIAEWIGVTWVAPMDIRTHFDSFSRLLGGKLAKKVLSGLWICVVWVVWRWRNKVIFENWMWDFKRLEEEIRGRFWSWCVAKGVISPTVSFLEWSRRNLYSFWGTM